MIEIDCSDCYTRVEFKYNTDVQDFSNIDAVIEENKDKIKMFLVDDYMFQFIEYVKDKDDHPCGVKCNDPPNHWVIGTYITPIPHLIYMVEDEIWFKLNKMSSDKFVFFTDNEIVISPHGMVFFNGDFVENLIHKYNLMEIKELTQDLCDYIIRKYGEGIRPFSIWNMHKCIGIY